MKRYLAVFLVLISLFAGCSQTDQVIKPSAGGEGYQTLGLLEVTESAKHNIVTRVLTLGLLKYRSFDRVKASLNAELVRKAKTHYRAESIINVKYWPDSDLARSTDLYHARGEMIRYEPFSKKTSPTTAPAVQG